MLFHISVIVSIGIKGLRLELLLSIVKCKEDMDNVFPFKSIISVECNKCLLSSS